MQQRAIPAVAAALGVMLLVAFAVFVFLAPTPHHAAIAPDAKPAPTWGRPAEEPVRAATPIKPGIEWLADPDWVKATAETTGIPERALAAYAGAAITKADLMPTCGIGWNTLAAIGWAESRHGTHGGSQIGDDGTADPGIFGPGLASVPDSDGGKIDGDATTDRAVGPMQLIPQTWRNWGGDASGDGIGDPQNIDDATMVTANYLCRASGDMASEKGWRTGIAAYNSAPSYIAAVALAADGYAG